MEKGDFINSDIGLLIISYLTGPISESDLKRLKEWIDVSDENKNSFNKIKDSWIISGNKKNCTLKDSEESWKNFKQKLSHSRLADKEENRPMKYVKLAASWLLFFGLGSAVTWWVSGRYEKTKETIATTANRPIEITTPLGARSIIRMPDSSQVWLNAGTTITYCQDYGQKDRVLNLTGEAFFKVAKDSLRPFIVNTQGIVIHALGTRFNVKAYSDEKTISTTLEEGKIDVRIVGMADNKNVLLKPKDKLIFHKEIKEFEKYVESSEDKIDTQANNPVNTKNINILSDVRTELYTSWKDSRWIIDREPLSSLAPMLERRYNIKIIFNDEQLKKLKFTGTIENETVDQILNALKLTSPIEYKINKDTLMLTMDIKAKERFRKIMIRNN